MIGSILVAVLLSAGEVGAATPSGEQVAQRIVEAATANWGHLGRVEVGDGEVWYEGSRHSRAVSYVLHKDGTLATLSIYSANCAPFPDRERLIALVIDALDPENESRDETATRQNRYSPDGNARVRVGGYTIVGFRTGDLYCRQDRLGIQNDVLPPNMILPPR